MENSISSRWTQLDLGDLIGKTKELAYGFWTGRILSPQDVLRKCNKIGVQASQLEVGTRDVWQKELAKEGYVVSYHDGKGNCVNYDDPKAVHYTLQEYGVLFGNDPKYQSKPEIFSFVLLTQSRTKG